MMIPGASVALLIVTPCFSYRQISLQKTPTVIRDDTAGTFLLASCDSGRDPRGNEHTDRDVGRV